MTMTGEPAYRVLAVEGDGVRLRATVELPAASALFAGHFPGRPVLPAVAQLWIVGELARQHLVPQRDVTAVDTLRCTSAVPPGARVIVELSHDARSGALDFSLFDGLDGLDGLDGDRQLAGGRLRTAPRPGTGA